MGEAGRCIENAGQVIQQEVCQLSFSVCSQLKTAFSSSQDATKCAENVQKLVALYRKHGTPTQLINALKYYLPESEVYPLLSSLPPPDATNPTGSTTFDAQDSIHNGFRVLEEIVAMTETMEEDTLKREVEKRRTRLGASSPEQLRKEVLSEISKTSQVCFWFLEMDNFSFLISSLRCMMQCSVIPAPQMN